MSRKYRGLTRWVAIVMAIAPPVAAQTVSSPSVNSFDQLPSVLQQLDTLVVTDAGGQEVRGALRQLTDTTIEVFLRDNTTRIFDRSNVQRIVVRDSIADGAQKGSLGGALPLLIAGLVINGGCRNEGGNCLGVVFGLAGLGAAIGAGFGAAIDRASEELVYEQRSGIPKTITERRGPRMSVRVAPTHASLGMSYGW